MIPRLLCHIVSLLQWALGDRRAPALGWYLGTGLASRWHGSVGGTSCTFGRSRFPYLRVIAIPALVVLFWLYYPAQTLLGISCLLGLLQRLSS